MKIDKLFERRLFINGRFCPSSTGNKFSVHSRIAEDELAQVYEADETDVDNAVAAAKSASATWKALSPGERGVYLRRFADLIEESQDELKGIEAIATGKPVSQFFEAQVAASFFRYFAEAGWNAQGTASLNTPGHVNISVKQPFGVVACITPWNLPILLFAYKVAPALAAGNTVVHKSSERAPLSALYLATLADKAGFPPGVLNMISGFGTPAGCALASHMDVRCLSFTGSSLTGQKIQMAAASSNMKHLHLELGGKSPALIFHDADLQAAAEQTAASMTFMSGQSCIANSRLYVDQSVGEEFISLFKKAFTSSRIGSPLEMNTSHGPQIDAAQRDRIESYIEIGRRDGLLLAGGNVGPGLFVQPTIFENIPESSPLMQEEVFGPVVVINHFKCETEAIERANKSEFGLYASVFTRNIDRALRVAKQLEAGTVAINCTSPTVATDMPLGGCKRSGIGREGYINSLENFLETKTLLIRANI